MTNDERKQVKKLHKEGWTYRQLAEKFGVNKSTIAAIIKKNK